MSPQVTVAEVAAAHLGDSAERFSQAHESIFGYRSDDEAVQISALRVSVSANRETPATRFFDDAGQASEVTRQAYFGPDAGWRVTPVLNRGALSHKRDGPLIIEAYDNTVVVPPGLSAHTDNTGALHIE